jgi:hypothetical protein
LVTESGELNYFYRLNGQALGFNDFHRLKPKRSAPLLKRLHRLPLQKMGTVSSRGSYGPKDDSFADDGSI